MVSQAQNSAHTLPRSWIVLFTIGIAAASFFIFDVWNMRRAHPIPFVLGFVATVQSQNNSQCSSYGLFDLSWHPPNHTQVNDIATVINGTGIYGYIFNSSQTPSSVPYSTYNWCNMPHTRKQEYVIPDNDFKLQYVEVIHRHHKRTPYQSNTFPLEAYPWPCDSSSLYYFGAPQPDNNAAQIAWSIQQSDINPFIPTGFPDQTCQFPQITDEGLHDSRQHGTDLFGVYHDTLHFLPDEFNASQMSFRVTNNVITSQVASQVLVGMYPSLNQRSVAIHVQPAGVDSLEPQYPCAAADALYSAYGVNSSNPAWLEHLNQSVALFAQLDAVSGVNTSNSAWHIWFDHYFDNLSAKLCHAKPLPCNITTPNLCVTAEMADAVFRRGLYEYSYIHRDNNTSLAAAAGSFGVWMAELAANFRAAMTTTTTTMKAGETVKEGGGSDGAVIYRHNVAHDGSMARLLSMLQVDVMVWPGMGSEVVFELWRKQSSGCYYTRVLWGGQVLRSSNPGLGRIEMLPVSALLAYIDGLVGVSASKVVGSCDVT